MLVVQNYIVIARKISQGDKDPLKQVLNILGNGCSAVLHLVAFFQYSIQVFYGHLPLHVKLRLPSI